MPEDAPDAPIDEKELHKLFEVWLDDDTKALVTVFYQHNPGVIETPEGLARRLGMTVDAIQGAIKDHLSIGLLREKKIGEQVVLMYNPTGRKSLESHIADAIRKKTEEAE